MHRVILRTYVRCDPTFHTNTLRNALDRGLKRATLITSLVRALRAVVITRALWCFFVVFCVSNEGLSNSYKKRGRALWCEYGVARL